MFFWLLHFSQTLNAPGAGPCPAGEAEVPGKFREGSACLSRLSAPSAVNQGPPSGGQCCWMLQPPWTPICTLRVGRQLIPQEGKGRTGLLSHQRASSARLGDACAVPGVLAPGRDSLEGWAQTPEWGKGTREPRTITFTR